MQFNGYRRSNAGVGTRNYAGIIATVVCANEVAESIATRVAGTACFTHHQGCCQTPGDIERVNQTLIGLGLNHNLANVLLVSLGCESTAVEHVAEDIAGAGKRVEIISIQDLGGQGKATAKGVALAGDLVREASKMKKSLCPLSDLVVGLKCGSSDTTSGLAPNPALGITTDLITAAGGTCILGEVTEFIGAEHLLARHAKDEHIGRQILALVQRMEQRATAAGADMRGGQPTGGNIKGGLTTIEEKSLGAISKAGTAPIQGVYEYGVAPQGKGLVVMDSPGREPEILTGLAAAGCNVIAFTTGRGAPQGFPFVPVVKITGNSATWTTLQEHLDITVASIIEGTETLPEAGRRILQALVDTASGKPTKAELSGYTRAMDIYVTGPVL